MTKALFLKLHRWVALASALPLIAVILSGLVLSFEPALKAMTPDGTVTLERLDRIIAAAPQGGALAIQGYAGTASLGGRGASTTYDLATGLAVQPDFLPGLFRTMRGLHERLLLDLGWLVIASTIALVLLALVGLLLGLPKLRNTVGGWHRATGWALLPLLVGSPLTGLALAFGITFTSPVPPPAGAAPPLAETIRQVAAKHDLDGLDFIRPMRGGQLVRVLDDRGTAIVYRAGPEGLVRQPDNWPRLLHEGGWGGIWGSALNLVTSIALVGLLGTGVFIWARRTLAKRRAKAARRLTPSAAG